jgi:hypothetical protein
LYIFPNWKFIFSIWKYIYILKIVKTRNCCQYNSFLIHKEIVFQLTLHERPLVAPVDEAFWPDRAALRWHRAQALRG